MHQNTIQIDRQTDLLPDIQPSTASHTTCTEEASMHAEKIEEDTAPVTANSEEHPASSQDSNRLEPQSQPVPIQYTKTLINPGKNIQTTTDHN